MSSQEIKSTMNASASEDLLSTSVPIIPTLKLLSTGDSYFNTLVQWIDSAQTEIFLESYIFNLDLIGERIFNALLKAKKRGVEVRLLVDGIGSFNWLSALRGRAHTSRLPFRVYHPAPFQMGLLNKLSWKNLRRLLLTFRRLNKRNHRKVLLIDGTRAILGSFNISQVHSEGVSEKAAWKDCAIAVENDPDVHLLRQSFLKTWKRSRTESFFDETSHHPERQLSTRRRLANLLSSKANLKSRFRLNDNWRKRRLLFNDLKKRIRATTQEIHILNPYFLPRPSLLALLIKAAQRGVKVHLCVPQRTDIRVVQLASRYLYNRLLLQGVRIYEYQPSTLHAKILVLDDWATVGSQNLNYRSLVHDLEVDVVISSRDGVWTEVRDFIFQCYSHSEVLSVGQEKNSPWENLLGKIIYQLRYWL